MDNKIAKKKRANKLANFKPVVVSIDPSFKNREIASSVLPEGASLAPIRKTSDVSSSWTGQSFFGGSGGSSSFHTQRPYMPEFDSPDRQFYPINRAEANRYWRMFYKYDAFFGTAVDMYASMMFGDFEVMLDNENDQTIKNQMTDMCDKVSLLDKLQTMVKEFLVLGESIPHTFFSDQLGIWSYMGFHNPDYIDVQDSPIIDMDPILHYLPDDNLRQMLTDNTPESIELRKRLPSEFVSKVLAKQKIRLSPLNCSYIPRKLHPYDERGTSLASRLWRIWMVEDAVYNSTIAMFRRSSSALKVLKLGDSNSGFIPGPSTQQEYLRMLANAEMDPQCFVPETQIMTFDGTCKNIGDLEIGDKLIDRNGKVCEVEVLQEEVSYDLYNIRLSGDNVPLKCTPNHKWPVWGAPRSYCRGNRSPSSGPFKKAINRGFNPYQKVEASDIKAGDYFMIPRYFEGVDASGVTPEMARLLGYYVSDGCVVVSNKKAVNSQGVDEKYKFELYFGNNEDNLKFMEDCKSTIKNICGSEGSVFSRKNALTGLVTSHTLRAPSPNCNNLAKWLLDNGGRYSHTKKLSKFVMGWPLHLKYELLKGLFAGDGCSTPNKFGELHVEYLCTSKDLVDQMRSIFVQMGDYVNIDKKIAPIGSYGEGNINYKISGYGDISSKLIKDVWGKESSISSKHCQGWFSDENYVYVLVKSIEKLTFEEPQKVINMTVSGDHSYLAHHFGTYNSWLVTSYAANFESWGNQEKTVTLSREHDTIEKVKLVALGLSKSFMTGEQSFSSAKSGLQVFLRRLLSMRQFFEKVWLLPKFFQPIIQINDWVKSTPSEINHKYRIKRTAQEKLDNNMFVNVRINWRNKLDPRVDEETLRAYMQLKNFGFDVSNDTVGTVVSLDWKDELRKKASEFKEKDELLTEVLGPTLKQKYEEANKPAAPKPPGSAGSGAQPPSGAKPPKAPMGVKPTSTPPGSGMDDSKSPLDESVEPMSDGGGNSL